MKNNSIFRQIIVLGFVFIVFLFVFNNHAYANPNNLDQSRVNQAICNIITFLEGSFGALVMIVAGVVAIISAAVGSYRLAFSLLFVAVGAFVMRSFLTVFFDPAILENCVEGGESGYEQYEEYEEFDESYDEGEYVEPNVEDYDPPVDDDTGIAEPNTVEVPVDPVEPEEIMEPIEWSGE